MNLQRALATAGIAALTALTPSLDVDAHSDDGIIEITTTQPAGPLTVTYDVSLTYAGDNEPADDATVTLAADGPDGATLGPVPLQPSGEPGHYTATITYPNAGDWAIRLSALSPLATLTRTDNITATTPAPTAPATTTGPAPTATPTTVATTDPTTSPASSAHTTTGPATTTIPADDDRSSSATPWIITGIALVAIAVIAAVVVTRRRTPAP